MIKKNSNKRFLGGLAVALLLPLSFYAIAHFLSKDKLHMPRHFIPDHIDSTEAGSSTRIDTVYHSVTDLELVNQLGETISLNKTLQGKILVVDFFFTNCPSVCPALTRNMLLLQKAFRKNPKMETSLDNEVQFISITVNPERDSFPILRAYADRYGANHDHWWFLTGDKKKIYNFARNQLFVSVQPGDGGADDLIHTQKMVLLDKNRQIRGYYDGLNVADVKRCADDIVLLSLEKDHNKN